MATGPESDFHFCSVTGELGHLAEGPLEGHPQLSASIPLTNASRSSQEWQDKSILTSILELPVLSLSKGPPHLLPFLILHLICQTNSGSLATGPE